MVEVSPPQYLVSLRLLRVLAALLAGGAIAEALGYLSAYLCMEDPQASGMIGNLIMQQLTYYFLGPGFVILSFSNILIKRGVSPLKTIRFPSLIFIFSIAATSYLLIPRMDYLRETALQDGMPVMLSPFANYFAILNGLTLLLLLVQILSSSLIAWRLTNIQSHQMGPKLSN
jgi:hypothetical protein